MAFVWTMSVTVSKTGARTLMSSSNQVIWLFWNFVCVAGQHPTEDAWKCVKATYHKKFDPSVPGSWMAI